MNLTLKIWRQQSANAPGKFVEYQIRDVTPEMSFLEMLDALNEDLLSKEEPPVAFEHDCREGICGSCGFLINGVAHGGQPRTTVCQLSMRFFKDGDSLILEPWRAHAFPLVRDLIVDRSRMFDHLRRVHAWVELDGTYDLGPGPRMDQDDVMERYAYSRCMTCGCCLEACPQYEDDHYIGPQAIAQVRLFNMHPSGMMNRDDRLAGIMQEDGITNCGNAQNCVKACPMNIPLTRAIYEENRETVLHGLLGWLKG